ncbi:MAG: MarR family winged helix-turn-helix transcriptional regulator [Sphingomonadales bacterium]
MARWRVLAVLHARDRRSIGELAAYTVMDQSTLSRVIDQMERDGLVERRQGRLDSRVVEVHILEAGNKAFDTILPKAMREMDFALKNFSEEERQALFRLLHKILDNIRTTSYR